MKEILLCKYGELTLKGLNRGYFEKLLYRDMKKRLEKAGNFSVTYNRAPFTSSRLTTMPI